MKKIIINLLTSISILLYAIVLPAQNLPVLPSDPAISTGQLPNGMRYYIAVNPSAKGHADFALVQRSGLETFADPASAKAVQLAKNALGGLPRINSSTAQSWMASHGVSPSAEGFINVTSDATVFRFNDVSLSYGKDVLDSTLLLLLTIVDRYSSSEDEVIRNWYAPSDQAVIVAGDVDAASVAAKLRSMSLMTPSGTSLPRKAYEWNEKDSAVFRISPAFPHGLANVRMEWRLPRAPQEYMNTIQPAIYERFVFELGYIAERRIRQALAGRGIAVADVNCHHKSSASGPGDELFTASVYVPEGYVSEALGTMARTFASIDALSVTLDEYKVAREYFFNTVRTELEKAFKDNEQYLERCVSAFLRNASLASPKEKMSLYTSRQMNDVSQLNLFNGMASALIDGRRNLSVICSYDEANDENVLRNIFYSAWSDSFLNPSSLDAFYSASSVEWPGECPKVKLKSARTDAMSGAQVYTYSNGVRVVYKKMDTGGKTCWTMALNGGYGSIENLAEGEGAYISDYFGLCRIAGLKGETFRDMLMTEGMTVKTLVGLTGTLFAGELPSDMTARALQIMLMLSGSREHDQEAFDRYLADESLRLNLMREGRQIRMAEIDGIMCPGYKYSWIKTPGKLGPGLASKADDFFARQSDKINDGVIILVTDKAEDEIKKMLLQYVGGFSTMGSAFRRPALRYQPQSGWSTYTKDGENKSIDVVMSVQMPLTMDNYMTAAIASMVLEKSMSDALADTGMYSDVKYNFQISPQERLSMAVSVEPLRKDAVASGLEHADVIEVLSIVRSRLSQMVETDVAAGSLNSSKEYLKSQLALRMKEPGYWTDAIAKRFLDGKDFTSSYAARIDAVTSDMVRNLLSVLNGGSKVEYVIR